MLRYSGIQRIKRIKRIQGWYNYYDLIKIGGYSGSDSGEEREDLFYFIHSMLDIIFERRFFLKYLTLPLGT